jgi:hypothetical protein
MKRTSTIAAFALSLAFGWPLGFPTAVAQPTWKAAELEQRTIERRAVESAIWGIPLVSVDAMRQAYFRDAGAKYNDIIYFSKPADWKFQFTTPNASTHYVYFNFNLKEGPVVLDIPPTVGAGLFGSLCDAWQIPLADVGANGDDKGKGGKYLLLPPNYKQTVPTGCFPIQFQTVNGYALLRAIPAGSSEEDQVKAIDLVKKIRLYSLAHEGNPPQQNYIDVSGRLINGVVAFDVSFYERLAKMVNEEPVQTRDLVAMGQLRSIGIEKGKEFKPDDVTTAILKEAAQEAHEGSKAAAMGGEPWWPGTQWKLPESIGPKTSFTFQTDDALYIDNRGMIFFLAFALPKKLGGATFYLEGGHDSHGQPLKGENGYRLHVPPNVPAKQYWAVTVYDLDTACLIRDMPSPGLDSYNQKMHRNGDASVDIYFGAKAPPGEEANWIPTAPGKPWFTMFRFYGPDKSLFEKTWKLPDIERLN